MFFSRFFQGMTMNLVTTEGNISHFVFEHNREYQRAQIDFWRAVESLNPQNIAVSI